jgi:hypothetical protein
MPLTWLQVMVFAVTVVLSMPVTPMPVTTRALCDPVVLPEISPPVPVLDLGPNQERVPSTSAIT